MTMMNDGFVFGFVGQPLTFATVVIVDICADDQSTSVLLASKVIMTT